MIFSNMGIGDWGLGIGDWGLGPIPNMIIISFTGFVFKLFIYKIVIQLEEFYSIIKIC